MSAASKAEKTVPSKDAKPSYRKIRKIMTPKKQGTVKRSVIRQAVRDVIANRPVANGNSLQ